MNSSASDTRLRRGCGRPRARGLTLVEMMVALALGLVVASVIVIVQAYLFRQNAVSSTEMASNNEARTALDMVSRDISSAGFLFGGLQSSCGVTLAYNSGGISSSGFVSQYPVWAQAAASGGSLPVLNGPTLNYPPAGSGVVDDVLVVTSALDASQFTNTSSPEIYLVQFGTTQSGSGNGAISSTQLPVDTLNLNNTQGINAGDSALLQVPMNGTLVCLRIPIVSIGTATGQGATYIRSKPSSYMPTNGYSDFSAQLNAIGLPSLSNPLLLQSRILDTGPAAASNERTQIYYIDRATYAWPTLMRMTVNTATDAILSTTPIAAGVVDMQVLFGVGSGAVTQYLRWNQVIANGLTSEVRTAQLGLVLRSIHPDVSYHAPASITLPNPSLGPATFTAYPVQAAESQDHFAAYTTEIPIRNNLWPR